jgi:hypothetical protein
MGHTVRAARGVLPFRWLWSWIVSVAEIGKQCAAFFATGEEPVDKSKV